MAVTIQQAKVWHGELTQPAEIISISVQSNDNPRIGCQIAAVLAENEIPVTFATVRPNGRKYEAIYGFGLQEDADRAVELIQALSEGAAFSRRPQRDESARFRRKSRSTGDGINRKSA
jgi:hypothetical protein